MSMKYAKYMMLLAAFAILVPLGAFARPKNERTVTFPDAVQVGSTLLKAGSYKVEWQGTGPMLRVSFLEYGKTVATAQAKMVESKTPFEGNEIVTTNTGKTPKLESIDFGGKTESLVLVQSRPGKK